MGDEPTSGIHWFESKAVGLNTRGSQLVATPSRHTSSSPFALSVVRGTLRRMKYAQLLSVTIVLAGLVALFGAVIGGQGCNGSTTDAGMDAQTDASAE